jgi:predicted Fe-Mo cluster-binding NifX family protein
MPGLFLCLFRRVSSTAERFASSPEFLIINSISGERVTVRINEPHENLPSPTKSTADNTPGFDSGQSAEK